LVEEIALLGSGRRSADEGVKNDFGDAVPSGLIDRRSHLGADLIQRIG
jgi:hypothetical protein